MSPSTELALHADNLTMQFGGLKAVAELNLEIPVGGIFGLIGPNGAGKTTAFNMLTGVYKPTIGKVKIFGNDSVGLKPYQITRFGIGRTFQNIRLFKNLTVEQNILTALDADPSRAHYRLLPSILRTHAVQRNEKDFRDRAQELLSIFQLDTRKQNHARNLPYGDQRRLEIARAMATGARLLLLDEPAAGMNHIETTGLMDTIRLI